MSSYRLEFDASGEPLLIEEENGTFKTPTSVLPRSRDTPENESTSSGAWANGQAA